MEDWEFVESRFDDLGNDLDEAKKHPFIVKVDFETRFRVWRDRIVPDRLLILEKDKSFETAVRLYDLIVRDFVRLFRRATKEFLDVADDIDASQEKLKFFQILYSLRQDLIRDTHNGYVNDIEEIMEEIMEQR